MGQGTVHKSLGRYQIQRLIGHGGMGEVWLGEDPRLHRQVAIKTLPIHYQQDQEFSLRFDREARTAAALNHPHILSIHDYGEQLLSDSGQVITYLVMPYIDGGSLADQIKLAQTEQRLIPQHEALAYLSQAAEAIDYAHEQGIVHRDIKPANMLLRPDHWLLLSDFGIARMLTQNEEITHPGAGIGTPEYIAPEQALGKAEAASDIYSLAVIAYQLFTGRLPFTGETGYGVVVQHLTMPPPSPHQMNPSLLPSVEEVLLRGLAKNPAQRFPSARAFVAELEHQVKAAPLQLGSADYQQTTPLSSSLAVTYADREQTEGQDNLNTYPTIPAKHLKLSATPRKARRTFLLGGVATLITLAAGAGTWVAIREKPFQTPDKVVTPTTPQQQPTPTAPSPSGSACRSAPWSLMISSSAIGSATFTTSPYCDRVIRYSLREALPSPVEVEVRIGTTEGIYSKWIRAGAVGEQKSLLTNIPSGTDFHIEGRVINATSAILVKGTIYY
ncbi:hypothetical protein KSF_006660 [Reticulibacter mediterranei]|uniref:non-specific serine/threonine protein kinase n=1 Tax=Reticulibacter mediterranei TaxID=2778369 RepID=A0A8J3IBL9_9CHLR|nr:serine/threonine-protein kinase [Reticulibacter mediterranei]GHO90618.1 hypothetical protein KSF_006660 [Reticulibacter mediterranei]